MLVVVQKSLRQSPLMKGAITFATAWPTDWWLPATVVFTDAIAAHGDR
jgi:hypothetical protein